METYIVDSVNQLAPAKDVDMRDPRGIVCLWEKPRRSASYVISVDPTVGKTGWDRVFRTADDKSIDNGAIQVLRIGDDKDYQVAEFAAPIDPYELARYVNVLGRLYCGNNDDEQALCIIEVYPGPGFATQRELIEKFGYTNMFVWKYLDSMTPKQTGSLGFYASPKAVRDLWIKGIRHISNKKVVIRSPYLIEELASCRFDAQRQRGEAVGGKHDDRVSSLLMGIWGGHDWNGQIDIDSHKGVETGPKPQNWQASDISSEAMMDEWERLWSEMLGEED
jgi:hypothetical protein